MAAPLLLLGLNLSLPYQKVQGVTTDLSASQIISLTNLERAKAGIKTLTPNSKLTAAAENKAEDMVAHGQFAHFYTATGSGEVTPWLFIVSEGYDYLNAGENLAKDFGSSEKLVAAWMNSPAHKDNLLSPNFTDVGVAVVEGPYLGKRNTTLVVMMLASPMPVIADSDNMDKIEWLAPLLTDNPALYTKFQQFISVWFLVLLAFPAASIVMWLLVKLDLLKKSHRLTSELWKH
jgi:hypothetical protein